MASARAISMGVPAAAPMAEPEAGWGAGAGAGPESPPAHRNGRRRGAGPSAGIPTLHQKHGRVRVALYCVGRGGQSIPQPSAPPNTCIPSTHTTHTPAHPAPLTPVHGVVQAVEHGGQVGMHLLQTCLQPRLLGHHLVPGEPVNVETGARAVDACRREQGRPTSGRQLAGAPVGLRPGCRPPGAHSKAGDTRASSGGSRTHPAWQPPGCRCSAW